MWELWTHLFDASGFPPRWYCGAWSPALGWLHILSDLGVWSAYFAIPCLLGYFAVRRSDLPFRGVLLLFVAFILACGTTHLMDAVVFWWPAYRLVGVLKLATAVISWTTFFALVRVAPRIMALRSGAELEAEITRRQGVEAALVSAKDGLEHQVRERTRDLQQSEAGYRLLADAMPQIVWTARPDGVVEYYNAQWYAYTGLSKDGDEDGWKSVFHPDDLQAALDRWSVAVKSGDPYELEFRLRSHASGAYRWHLGRALPARDESGRIVQWYGTFTDIDDRKRTEELLRGRQSDALIRARDAKFQTIINTSIDAYVEIDASSQIVAWNKRSESMFGWTREEALGRSLVETILPLLHRKAHVDGVELFLRTGVGPILGKRLQVTALHRDGREFPIELAISPVRHESDWSFSAFIQDITEQKLSEQRTQASLREKEVLLREIHHRVKNNLQIVSTLLDLQSEHTTDPEALRMFQESRGRVKSMALIHERLYRSQEMARVNFGEYIRQLAADLYRTYRVSQEDIRLELNVDIPPLTIDIAIPCGLLLNELMSNCFKHAFAQAASGCIRVSLYRGDDGVNVLSVSDDGVGFPEGTDFRATTSFGLQLVATLVDQLDGEVALTSDHGTLITIRFPGTKP